ncbi:22397_t:CDS:2, partial [Rhizophagus irregularis]
MPLELRRFLCKWYSILYEKEQNEILGFMDLRFMEPEISNTELWQAEYFQEGCDSIIAVYRILCRATKFKNMCVEKRKYLSIFHCITFDNK